MRWRLPLLATLISVAAAVPAHGAELRLDEAKTTGFPERSYVVGLPDKRVLGERDISVIENGQPVSGLEIEAGGRSAVILAIDASESMHSGAIDEAIAAAREFAARRRPDQELGIIFFSREPTVALEPTTDALAIDAVLSQSPPLSRGTRIYDAASAGLELVEAAKVDTAAVVVLSDGADFGSLTSRDEVVRQAAATQARLFTVGLRSPSFSSVELRALAAHGGEYAEAQSADDLARVFGALGDRLASEYLISYESQAPLGTDVAVTVEVAGVGEATVAYRTPAALNDAVGSVPATDSPWRSMGVAIGVIGLVAALLAIALYALVRPRRLTVEERIASFVPEKRSLRLPSLPSVSATPALESADHWLERFTPWTNLKLDIDVAEIRVSAIRLLLVTAVATLSLVALIGLVAGNTLVAIMAFILIPVLTRAVVAMRANRVRRRFEDQLPDNLQVLASGLRAGHSFVGALNVMVADAPDPSRREYRRVVTDEQLGISIEDSLKVVADRMRCEDVVYIGLIATLQRDTGGNTAEVLDKVVETLRERAKIRRLVRTLTVQGRLGGWIVTALPIAMILFLNLTQPDFMDPMTSETAGIVILIIAGLGIAAGAYAIRRIVDIKV